MFRRVNRIRLLPLKRDDHPDVLIGAGGTRRSDWPARVWVNDVSTRIHRSITRVEGQVAAICYRMFLLSSGVHEVSEKNDPSPRPSF